MKRTTRILAAFAGTFAFAAAGGAQFAPPPLDFGFANPGARSMGFGGAFVALADDATAAFSNPAGLVQLTRMEISFEARVEIEDRPELSGSAVGFASFVYPRKKFSLALYHTGLADLEFGATSGAALVGHELFFSRDVVYLESEVTGLSGAFRVKEGLAIGLGLVSFRTRLSADLKELVVDLRDFTPQERLVRSSILEGEETDLRWSAGVLWDFAPSWRLGAFYRQGPSLDVGFLGTSGPAAADPVLVRNTPISFPDTYGAGIAWKTFRDRLTTSFEWNRTERSILLDGLDRRIFDTASYALEDSDDFHLGLEYVVASKPAVALRVGAWREDASRLRRLGASDFSGASDVDHVSGGFGVAFRKLQLDMGFDTSELTDLVSVSLIYSFD